MSYASQPRAADVDTYARVSRSFPAWLRRNFRGDRIARELAYHLVMSVNPVGVEFLPVAVMAGFIDASIEQVEAAIAKLSAAGFLRYDHDTEFVWVVEQAAWQVNVGNTKNQDAMVRRLVRPAFGVPNFWPEFMQKYEVNLRLNLLGFGSENLPVNCSPNSSPKSSDNSSPNSSVKSMVTQDAGYRMQDAGSSGGSNAHVREHTHAREAGLAAAALTPEHDPWPEQASRAAAHLYIATRRAEGVEPVGDVCEPFERAVCVLTTKLGIPREQAGPTLERIVRHASTDPAVRRARAGDLFKSPFYLLGNPSPKPGAGVPMVDKLRRYLEDLAQVDAAVNVQRTGRLEAAAKDRADYVALEIGEAWDQQNPELLAELEAAGMIPQAIASKAENLPVEARNDLQTSQCRGSALNGRTGVDFGPSCASGLEAV